MFGALLFTAGVESAYGQELKFKGSKMRRLDREIHSGSTFGYKGEWMTGLTASYGTLTSEDSQFWMYLDNIKVGSGDYNPATGTGGSVAVSWDFPVHLKLRRMNSGG